MGSRRADKKLTNRQVENHRASIDVGRLLGRLQGHVDGQRKMTATQVRAAEILLRKCLPDLSSHELAGKDGAPIIFQEVTRKIVK